MTDVAMLLCTTVPAASRRLTPSFIASNVPTHWRTDFFRASSAETLSETSTKVTRSAGLPPKEAVAENCSTHRTSPSLASRR